MDNTMTYRAEAHGGFGGDSGSGLYTLEGVILGTVADKCIRCGAHHLSDEYCESNNPLEVGALDDYHELDEEEHNEDK